VDEAVKDLMSVKEAVRYLGGRYQYGRIDALVRSGDIPAVQPVTGGKRFIRRSDLDAWVMGSSAAKEGS